MSAEIGTDIQSNPLKARVYSGRQGQKWTCEKSFSNLASYSSCFRDRRNQSLKHSRLTASLAVQGRQMRMQLALLTTFAASRKEPVAEVLERVHAAIMASGQGEPSVMFTLSDGPIVRVSSIDRVLKRRPELK